jgi:hypothetical protein
MPRRFQMGVLVTRCQQRCDLEHSGHISPAEWRALISEAYGELWSTVSGTGLRYFETSTTITADGSDGYIEPADHYSTSAITRVSPGGRESMLDPLMPQEEPAYKGLTGDARRWTLVDDQLHLYPRPTSGTYKWYYLQQPTDLASYADDDIVDVVTPDGEAFLIWAVAVKARAKGEAGVQVHMAERERYREQLVGWAADRAITEHNYRVQRDAAFGGPLDDADWRWR